MSKNNLEVRVTSANNINKLIPSIRKYNGESINEIKMHINDNKPIITCYYIDNPDQLPGLLDVIMQLKKNGAVLELRQTIRNTSKIININIIRNLLERDKIIQQQIEEYDDNLTN
ncbi:hypothetical protein [Terribacillus saccharophilus]|uniref:hypothetical protein n=1 Tax=Terribacillus saccharophilus TaxID=361277 RepID=UPI003D2B43EF